MRWGTAGADPGLCKPSTHTDVSHKNPTVCNSCMPLRALGLWVVYTSPAADHGRFFGQYKILLLAACM